MNDHDDHFNDLMIDGLVAHTFVIISHNTSTLPYLPVNDIRKIMKDQPMNLIIGLCKPQFHSSLPNLNLIFFDTT